MPLPHDLLQAVSAPGGGKVSLVVGAGCSIEHPTCIPAAATCSAAVHRRLVDDGVLQNGDCSDPNDLSLVADAVFNKTGSQRPVVERFRDQYDLKTATPNQGYLIAAAMLCEGVVSSVVTLNFDLAMTHALVALGASELVAVIDSPADLPHQKGRNVYYLHRNVNATDPETWVLRTATLTTEWKNHWESIIASNVLSSPVVVFAGLGTPTSVLVDTTTLIRGALPAAIKFFQVDPVDKATSKVFTALKIGDTAYVQKTWGVFMDELAARVVREFRVLLEAALTQKVTQDNLTAEDATALLNRLDALGLVDLGRLRAHWLLHERAYCPEDPTSRAQIADLILGLCLVGRVGRAEPLVLDEGLVEFQRDGRTVAVYAIASGRGHRGKAAMEAQVEQRRKHYRSRPVQPLGAIVAGTSDAWTATLSPPEDVVRGDATPGIVTGPVTLPLIHISELRSNNARITEVIP